MPIPIKKLHTASKPLEVRLLEFLRSNMDNAYSVPELAAGIDGLTATPSFADLLLTPEQLKAKFDPYYRALERLLLAHKVVAAVYQGARYYGLAPSEPPG